MISTTSDHCPSEQFAASSGFACFLLFRMKSILKAEEKSILEQMLEGIWWDSGTPPAVTCVQSSHYGCTEEGSSVHGCSQTYKI